MKQEPNCLDSDHYVHYSEQYLLTNPMWDYILPGVKNPDPGPGFDFTPKGWFWPSENPWNNGILEYWGSKADDGLILFSGPCRPFEKDLIPTNPVFQHSNLSRRSHASAKRRRIFHHSTA